MKDCDIKLYALTTCIHCKDTKEFLDKCGVDYDCVNVDKLEGDERRQMIEEIKKANPGCAFPMLMIGSKVIIGFKRDEIKEALNLE
ncbi:MAG: glutaredoxin family protein [Syntrophobacteraceae bacterium]|jgi:glutaredoxin-like protein NrdH|nr:Glutaredoxin [Syntrophobacter sp. SbD2]